MGNWHISIEGVGCHHNAALPEDANRMAQQMVKDLEAAGHTVVKATFTHGAADDLKTVDYVAQGRAEDLKQAE